MFKTRKDFKYQMPAHFGGGKFDPEFKLLMKAVGLNLSYETDGKLLENFIPEGFELLKPEVHVGFTKFTEINWMNGGQYNVINVGAPVRFHGKKDTLDGSYTLVVWENRTDPILGGREESGIPKVYSEIEDLHVLRPHYFTNASYNGNTFINMGIETTGEVTGNELDELRSQLSSLNTLGWRYIPKVGAPGSDLSQFILYPQAMEIENAETGNASLSWTELTPMQSPMQYGIVNSLASLPIKKLNPAILFSGSATLHATGSRVIE